MINFKGGFARLFFGKYIMAKERIKVIREEMLQVANNVAQEKGIDKDSVFEAMEMAGTPCPYMGAIGPAASDRWEKNEDRRPDQKKGVKSKILGVFSSDKIEVDQISNVTADEAAYLEKCTRPDFKGRRKSTKSCEAEWHDSK